MQKNRLGNFPTRFIIEPFCIYMNLLKVIKKAVDGFEPTIKLLQSRALPLGYTATTIPLYNRMIGFVKKI
jgi:hypothetical protein